MLDSDSEEDFMSDKFLVDAGMSPNAMNYSDKRKAAQKRHLESQPRSLKQREEETRRKGLETSLFEVAERSNAHVDADGAALANQPGNKALDMMLKMGWKLGEGLGKKVESAVTSADARAMEDEVDFRNDEKSDRTDGTVISRKRRRSADSFETDPLRVTKQKFEPLSLSMWSGKCGLGSKRESPMPLLASGELHPGRPAQLESSTQDFRKHQAELSEAKNIEGKEWAARKILIDLDEAKGIRFHPLHVIAQSPARTIPVPLLKLIFPLHADIITAERREYLREGSSAKDTGQTESADMVQQPSGHSDNWQSLASEGKRANTNRAERLRQQMKLDALIEVEGLSDQDLNNRPDIALTGSVSLRRTGFIFEGEEPHETNAADMAQVNWDEHIDGTKRVLAMDPRTHLSFLLDMLRMEHSYCFWCGFHYSSIEEMDGSGGCPGESEEDH